MGPIMACYGRQFTRHEKKNQEKKIKLKSFLGGIGLQIAPSLLSGILFDTGLLKNHCNISIIIIKCISFVSSDYIVRKTIHFIITVFTTMNNNHLFYDISIILM